MGVRYGLKQDESQLADQLRSGARARLQLGEQTNRMTTVLVTGSTDGIGLRTAQVLAEQGNDVIVHGRSAARVDAAVASIGSQAVAGIVADLSDLDQVPELAGAANSADVLINNAGIYERERLTNADGEEVMWTVNHMAPSLLTALMLPEMPERGRVVYVSSTAHGRGKFDLADPGYAERRYNHFRAHMTTKLANLLMAREWARRQDRVDFFATHPGVIGTKLMTEGFQKEGANTLDEGAAALIFAASSPSLTGQSGAFVVDNAVSEPTGPGLDDQLAAQVFDYTMEQLGLSGPQA